MHNKKELDKATLRGIAFIEKNQNKDGSFNSFSHTGSKTDYEIFVTTFYASLILFGMAKNNDRRLIGIREKTSKFLISERNNSGTYNYWARSFVKYQSERCPDDLDDTFCALSALFSSNKKLVDEKLLAKITKILISQESKEGGPYYTWVVPRNADQKWKDVDLAVNANIGLFLSVLGITLPSIENLINKAIENNDFSSTYYPNYSTMYFVSRSYKGKLKTKLLRILLEENSKPFRNALECSLLGLSLLYQGERIDSIKNNIEYLIHNQKNDGSFGAPIFIIERTYTKNKRLSGSEAFTTALAIELITKYQSESLEKKIENKKVDYLSLKKEVIKHTRKLISKRFKNDVLTQFNDYFNKIIASDSDGQIVLHPFLFLSSFKKDYSSIDKEFFLDLAAANIFGWISYTIFDNITDENKDIDKLSLALICHRELEKLFCKNNPGFENISQKILDRVDFANFYEYKYARQFDFTKIKPVNIYPNAIFVAEKSIAHSLTPLAIIYKLGYKENSFEFKTLLSFYRDYLTARQLNDDSHDWEEDLARGQINYVGEMLLNDFSADYKSAILLPKHLVKLRKKFWNKTILEACKIIKSEIIKAKKELFLLSPLLDQNYLEKKLSELEESADKAVEERGKTKRFINAL